jgi:hypothetical protein
MLWNLPWIGLCLLSTDGLVSYAVRERGGWVVRQIFGARPAPPPEVSRRDAETAPRTEPAESRASGSDAPSPGLPSPPAPTEPREILRCALRARLASATFGGYDFLDASPECLTRETAAAFGSGIAQHLGLGSAFQSMGQELKGLLGKPVSSSEKERTREEGSRIEERINEALSPWGVTLHDLTFGRKKDRIIPGGRRFLREMSGLKRRVEPDTAMGRAHAAKLEKQGVPPGGIDPDLVSAFADAPADVAEFGPAEGGRRRMVFRGKPPDRDEWELVYEDGAWRAGYVEPTGRGLK